MCINEFSRKNWAVSRPPPRNCGFLKLACSMNIVHVQSIDITVNNSLNSNILQFHNTDVYCKSIKTIYICICITDLYNICLLVAYKQISFEWKIKYIFKLILMIRNDAALCASVWECIMYMGRNASPIKKKNLVTREQIKPPGWSLTFKCLYTQPEKLQNNCLTEHMC